MNWYIIVCFAKYHDYQIESSITQLIIKSQTRMSNNTKPKVPAASQSKNKTGQKSQKDLLKKKKGNKDGQENQSQIQQTVTQSNQPKVQQSNQSKQQIQKAEEVQLIHAEVKKQQSEQQKPQLFPQVVTEKIEQKEIEKHNHQHEQKQVFQQKLVQQNQSVHFEQPKSKINQEPPAQNQYEKQARQQSQRMSEFRRKHMIFPPKQSQEHHHKQPLGNKVLHQTIQGLQHRLHRSPPIQYVDLDESRLISATTASKKRQNYKLFREWNENRSKQLQCYAYVVDHLFKAADDKIRESFEHLEIYITFFKQRGNQQERYSSTPIIDTGYTLNKNEIGATAFSQCSQVMKTIGEFNLERCKKIQNFAYLIKKNIMADLLEDHTTKSKQQLSSLKDKILAVRHALQEARMVISKKTVQLGTFVEQNPSPQTKSKDYYYSQVSFLRTANQITNIMKKFGELTYNFFESAAELEKERIGKVKSAIAIYIQGLKETYGFEESKEIQEKLNLNNPKVIESIYNVSALVDGKLQEYIKNELQVEISEPLTAQQLKLYLEKLTFKPYDNRLLTLKQFKTVIINKDKANETCNIVITVDKFIHIYLNTESAHIYAKPTQTFKIDPNIKVFRQGSVVQLAKSVEKKGVISYIIWEPPTVFKYVIQFAKDDAALEFEDCIKKLL